MAALGRKDIFNLKALAGNRNRTGKEIIIVPCSRANQMYDCLGFKRLTAGSRGPTTSPHENTRGEYPKYGTLLQQRLSC